MPPVGQTIFVMGPVNRTIRATCAIVLQLSACLPAAAQISIVEWKVDSTIEPKDREAILALAKRGGIDEPRTVSAGVTMPFGCRYIAVASHVEDVGNRATWREMRVKATDWKDQYCHGGGSAGIGRWVVLSSVTTREAWRIRDDAWHLDLYPVPDVPYADAELIVRALRRKTFTNRLAARGDKNELLAQFDVNHIIRIVRDRSDPSIYAIETGFAAGLRLSVRIVNGRVELRDIDSWIT